MNAKAISGLLLLAGAGVVAFLWWQRRNSPQASAEAATGNAAAGLGALEQVGSNFNEDSSPDVVKAALDYAGSFVRDNGPYWFEVTGCDNHNNVVWENSATGKFRVLPCGQVPVFIPATP